MTQPIIPVSSSMRRGLVLLSLALIAWATSSASAQNNSAPASDEAPAAAQENPLAGGQTQLATRFKKLEGMLLRSAEVEASTNPTRAALMQQAAALAKQVQLSDSLVRAARSLEQKQYSQAIEDQKASLDNLNKILELLQSENRADRQREQRDQIRRTIEEAERLLRLQSSLRGRTEGGTQTEKAASDQQKLAEKAAQIAKDLAPDSKDPKNKNDQEGNSKEANDKNGDDKKSGDKQPDGGDKKKGEPSDKDKAEKDKAEADKSGENKDGKNKDGDPSNEKKSGDQKSGDNSQSEKNKSTDDKKSDDKKSDDKKADDKKSDDKKSDDKSDDKKTDDDKSETDKQDPANPSDGPKSDDKKSSPGQPKPSQTKPSQQGEQSPEQSPDSQQPSGDQQDSSSQPPPPEKPKSATERAAERMKQVQKNMQEAQKKLQEAERQGAVEKQRQAEQELKSAIEELEEILRQLREEEIERSLTALEERLRLMLQLQNKVLDESKRLAEIGAGGNDRQVEIRANNLANDEKKIVGEAQRALLLLREEGTSAAFPESLSHIISDMQKVVERLTKADIGKLTIGIEEDIVSSLEELVAAMSEIKKENKERQEKQMQVPGQQQGQPGEQPLVNQLAEMRLIKTLQIRINKRTQTLAEVLKDPSDPVGQAEATEIQGQLRELAERQSSIKQVTRDIVTGKNKQ